MNDAILRFDRLELQLAERRVLCDGQELTLRGRAFDVLAVLAQHRGRLVSKGDLLARVWPGLVVEEGNIAVQIAAVRKALPVDLIATVPGHGYRLVAAPAATASAEPAAPPSATPATAALYGRDEDLARLQAALRRPGCVTLTGPGGVGKTALAQALLAAWDAGPATWLDLSACAGDDAVQPALCAGLGLEAPCDRAGPALTATLGAAGHLLVLDNAEHVLDAVAALVPRLVAALPRLHLLITSQAALRVGAERVERLQPLQLPPAAADAAETARNGAVALFMARVQAADSRVALGPAQLPLVRQLCTQLDGLPLALEMAAARVPLLGLQGVLDALGERFALLRPVRRDAPVRHRSLQAAMDWSFDLLAPAEQQLFCALGVITGSFTLDLAVAVAGGTEAEARWNVIDGIALLVDRSLVSVGPEDPPRYRLLESLRHDALARLTASGQVQPMRARHAQALLVQVRRADMLPAGAEREALTRRVLEDMGHVREAFHWALLHDQATAVALSAHCAALVEFSAWRSEVFSWQRQCEALVDDSVALPVQALWWRQYSRHLHFLNDPGAVQAAARAMRLARAAGDDLALFWALAAAVRAAAAVGGKVEPATPPAVAAWVDEMAQLLQAHPAWPPETAVFVSGARATQCINADDFEGALQHRQAELALARRGGLDTRADIAALNVGWTLNRLGRHAEALAAFQAFIAADRGSDFNRAYARVQVVRTLVMMRRLDEALAEAPQALAASRRVNWLEMTGVAALLVALHGRLHSAALLLGHARQAYALRGWPVPTAPLFDYRQAADLLSARLDPAEMADLMERGSALDAEAADRLLFSGDDRDDHD
jgi:non-specific serine/threonine protein kinase